MKRISRTLAIALSLALVFALLAGCGGGQSSGEEPGTSQTAAGAPGTAAPAQPSEEAQTPEPAVHTVSYPLFEDTADMTVMMGVGLFLLGIISEDEGLNACYAVQKAEEATNVHINFNYMRQGNYGEQFAIMVAGGDYPDMMACPEANYTGGIDALIDDGICIDIAPYLDEYAPDFVSRLYGADESYYKQITSDTGKVTTVWVKEAQYSTGTQIRKDWLDELGMEVPATYDELYDVLYAFKNELGARNAILLPSNLYVNSYLSGGLGVAGSVDTFGGDLVWQITGDGGAIPSVMAEGYPDWLNLLRTWYTEGFMSDDVYSISASFMVNDHVYANETGVWLAQADTLSQTAAETAGGSYHAIPIADMTKTGSETIPYGKEGGNISVSGGWAISTQCEYPMQALSYINWYFTEDGYFASNFGEQGVAFDYDANGDMYFTDAILHDPNGLTTMVTSSLNIVYFDIPHYYSLEKKMLSLATDTEKASQTVWPSNRSNDLVYYGDLNIEESATYSGLIGDICTYAEESLLKFFSGELSIEDDYDAYIQHLHDLGIQQLIDVKQAAYERYLQR